MKQNKNKIPFILLTVLSVGICLVMIYLFSKTQNYIYGIVFAVSILVFAFSIEKLVAIQCSGCGERIANPFISTCPFCKRPIDRNKK